MNIVKVAHLYDRGFRGFPLARDSKAPERGMNIRSFNCDRADTIRYAAERRLAWHLSKTRLVVVDWDPLKDKGLDEKILEYIDWLKSNSNSDSTIHFLRTPSGGAHFYYRVTDWHNMMRYANTHMPGLDIKHFGDSYVKVYNMEENFQERHYCTSAMLSDIQGNFDITMNKRPTDFPGTAPILNEDECIELHKQLNNVDPDMPYTEWGSVACALKTLCGAKWGIIIFIAWSERGRSFRGEKDTFDTFNAANPFVGDARKFIYNLAKRDTYAQVMRQNTDS